MNATQAAQALLRVVHALSGEADPTKVVEAKTAKRAAEDVQEVLDGFSGVIQTEVRSVLESSIKALSEGNVSFKAIAGVNTNVFLASTCRAFHRPAQPILRREAHLFTPGQVERFGRLVEAMDPVELAYRQLTVSSSSFTLITSSGPHRGERFFEPLLHKLLQTPSFQSFRLQTQYDRQSLDSLIRRFGMSYDDWNNLIVRASTTPSQTTTNLFFGSPSIPYEVTATTLEEQLGTSTSSDHLVNLATFRTFSVPYLAFFPRTFLSLFRHTPSSLPNLQHLDVGFQLSDSSLSSDLECLKQTFTLLAPLLRRLTLRFRGLPRDTNISLRDGLADALRQCRQLISLEIGGVALDETLLDAVLPAQLALRTLVLLPLLGSLDLYNLADIIDRYGEQLLSMVLFVPTSLRMGATDGWNEKPLRLCEEAADRQAVVFELGGGESGERWMLSGTV
ncbi:hypothetical protein JCM8097_006425 [Rhodosporidiobolus ruineniae]